MAPAWTPRKAQAAALTIPVGGPQHGNNVELWKAQKTLWEINEDGNRTLFGQNEVFSLSAGAWGGVSLGMLTFPQASLLEKEWPPPEGPLRPVAQDSRGRAQEPPCTELLRSILPSPTLQKSSAHAHRPYVSPWP